MLGEKTAVNPSRSDAAGDDKEGLSTVGVPLMRAEEILRMKRQRQLIVRGGMLPIKVRHVPYYARCRRREMTDPNPYR